MPDQEPNTPEATATFHVVAMFYEGDYPRLAQLAAELTRTIYSDVHPHLSKVRRDGMLLLGNLEPPGGTQ